MPSLAKCASQIGWDFSVRCFPSHSLNKNSKRANKIEQNKNRKKTTFASHRPHQQQTAQRSEEKSMLQSTHPAAVAHIRERALWPSNSELLYTQRGQRRRRESATLSGARSARENFFSLFFPRRIHRRLGNKTLTQSGHLRRNLSGEDTRYLISSTQND